MLGLLGGLIALIAMAFRLMRPSPEPVATHCTPAPVDPERLKAHVRTLSETFHPRDHAHPENLERTAGYLADAFSRAGGRVSSEPYTADGAMNGAPERAWLPLRNRLLSGKP